MIRIVCWPLFLAIVCLTTAQSVLQAEQSAQLLPLGDPQIRTDHPWFPGELSCSTFERLFETQAELYHQQTDRDVITDEDKAIASWYWRNLNYYHAYCPREAFWGDQITSAEESPRDAVLDYWTGLFGYGFSLCYTTHQQYTAEMEKLLGHGRSRSVDVDGHTSFEVFLEDAPYGVSGDWALLDHDISTIVFDNPVNPQRLIQVADVAYLAPPHDLTPRPLGEREAILDNSAAPQGNRGWFKSGLYFPSDDVSDATNSDAIGVYTKILGTAPLSGYAAVPPMMSMKRGETIRRYLEPGLGDETYVYWGPNYQGIVKENNPIPGPSRDRTWASQPEQMYSATRDTDSNFARYGNVVSTYRPCFAEGSYRDGVITEDEQSVTFYFYSPYAVAAMPPDEAAQQLWAVHSDGCTNGLVISAEHDAGITLQVSTNNGSTWSVRHRLGDDLDLTDWVKGHHSYHLKFNAPPSQLEQAQITIRTVCMANDRLMPHLKSEETVVSFNASGKAIFAAGPNVDQASPFITSGGFGTDRIEMRVPAPNNAPIIAVHAAVIVNSGPQPDGAVDYQIDCSTDGGATWKPIVGDWNIKALGYQIGNRSPWSFCFGDLDITQSQSAEVLVRFSNDSNITFERAEVYLIYRAANELSVSVKFDWTEHVVDRRVKKSASHLFDSDHPDELSQWTLKTGDVVQTNWVEMSLAP